MNESLKNILKDIKNSLPEEWKEFLDDPEETKAKISQFARDLPVEVYEAIRDEIISRLFSISEPSLAILNFVVDSNIIVSDSFRVGRGKKSSTERIFSSVFVKLYAPKSLEEEVFVQIKEDLPKGCSLETAITHAKRLISKIELIDDSNFNVEYSELPKFKEKFGNDASFLKVGIVLGVKRIITKDKAFDQSKMVKRFELGEAVNLIVTAETGALSISVIGGATYLGGKAIYWLLLSLYKALTEIYVLLSMIISEGIAGLIGALEKAPKWLLAIIISVLAAAGIAFVISDDLGDKAKSEIIDLYDWILSKSKSIFDALSNILKGLTDIAVVFKDELGPYFLNVGLAMMISIVELKETLETQ